MGFPRQGYWSGLPFSSPGDLPDPGIEPSLLWLLHCGWILYQLSYEGSPVNQKEENNYRILTHICGTGRLGLTRIPLMCVRACVLVAQPCPTLCDPTDCSPSGSSVHGILQARTLEWVAIPFSRGSSRPRDRSQVFCTAGRFFTI